MAQLAMGGAEANAIIQEKLRKRKEKELAEAQARVEKKKEQEIILSPSARPTGPDVGKTPVFPKGVSELPRAVEATGGDSQPRRETADIQALIDEQRGKILEELQAEQPPQKEAAEQTDFGKGFAKPLLPVNPLEMLPTPKDILTPINPEELAGRTAGTIGQGAVAAGLLFAAPTIIGAGGSAITGSSIGSIFGGVGLKSILTLGGIGVLISRKANSSNGILTNSLSAGEEIIAQLESGQITSSRANELFEEYMSAIDEAEQNINTTSKLDIGGFLGLKDNLIKFQIARDLTIPDLRVRLQQARINAVLRSRGLK